ncbi:meiotic recombination protein REC114 [Egretta garzetta]|uniref:meiotic recombination protein REC114 n=1 Tax=Egretta garzetta TaxID=188379 RepID=UPI00163D1299|nr:meiotic recombination protein REC114 [Egretta garzetta]
MAGFHRRFTERVLDSGRLHHHPLGARYTGRLWGEGGGSSRAPLGEVLPSKADGTGQDETPSRQPRAPPRTGERQRRRACERSLEKDQRDPECATSLALVSLPPADWRTILPTRSVFLPIGFCFPLNLWLPAAGAVLAAPCCAAPSPQGRDGGGERGWHLPGGEKKTGDTSLLTSATTWPLKRYGRFLPPTDSDVEGQNTSSWKVFESNEESGHLILTIVVSGHFFISQGRTVLEGFSLIDSHKWLKIVRRADCLLLHAQSKNECRIFRVQFGGDSKEKMLEHCCSCIQKLAGYVPVQVTDEQSQKLHNGEKQVKDTEQNASSPHIPDEPLPDSHLGERRSVTQLAQSVLKKQSELPLVHQHSTWSTQELGPFIRLCLMDQNFLAFVEDVEKELKKLAEG